MFLLTALYAVAIFLSGFLLFLVEPMAGKRLLPLLGGSSAVWTTCLVFFQCALLLGYFYAHRLANRLSPAVQRIVHVVLLLCGLVVFAMGSRAGLHASAARPVWSVFSLLSVLIGIPFLALSATSPLLQSWYSASFAGGNKKLVLPYHLFALSNLGSLLALITYPVLIEPYFSLHAQNTVWTAGFAVLTTACGCIAWKSRNSMSLVAKDAVPAETSETEDFPSPPPPPMADKILWLLLAGCGSLLLCAVTGYLSQNVAAIPLLWILPLLMYLLSFVLVFQRRSFYPRSPLLWLLALSLASVGYFLTDIDANPEIKTAVPLFCLLLLIACLFCHGELHRLRPEARYVTSFYLYIAAGGALGAIFVGVIAPLVFSANYEFVVGLALTTLLAAAVTWRFGRETLTARFSYLQVAAGAIVGAALAAITGHLYLLGYHKSTYGLIVTPVAVAVLLWRLRPTARWGIVALAAGAALLVGIRARTLFPGEQNFVRGLLLFAAVAAFVLWWRGVALRLLWLAGAAAMIAVIFIRAHSYAKDILVQERNFYGALRVTETNTEGQIERTLYNGTIDHGEQIFTDNMRRTPTTYYALDSGVGAALRFCCGDRPRRVGIIGLGTGTIAAYGRSGDAFRFYDINPLIEPIARSKFAYLRESAATIQVIPGDARISLAEEPSQQFDVLAIDAFSGDAVPVHLLTEQAMKLYQRHMRPGGIIAFHISNRYLDLSPVLQQQADHAGLGVVDIASSENDEREEYEAEWVLLTSDQAFLAQPEVNVNAVEIKMPRHGLRLWTDDYNSLLPLLK